MRPGLVDFSALIRWSLFAELPPLGSGIHCYLNKCAISRRRRTRSERLVCWQNPVFSSFSCFQSCSYWRGARRLKSRPVPWLANTRSLMEQHIAPTATRLAAENQYSSASGATAISERAWRRSVGYTGRITSRLVPARSVCAVIPITTAQIFHWSSGIRTNSITKRLDICSRVSTRDWPAISATYPKRFQQPSVRTSR